MRDGGGIGERSRRCTWHRFRDARNTCNPWILRFRLFNFVSGFFVRLKLDVPASSLIGPTGCGVLSPLLLAEPRWQGYRHLMSPMTKPRVREIGESEMKERTVELGFPSNRYSQRTWLGIVVVYIQPHFFRFSPVPGLPRGIV